MARANRSLVFLVLALLMATIGSSADRAAVARADIDPIVLTNWGTATLDGVISDGEYGENGCGEPAQLTAGGTTYHLQACETNDAANDYYAFKVDDLTQNEAGLDAFSVFFDNEGDGTVKCKVGSQTVFQDLVAVGLVPGSPQLFDANYCTDSGGHVSGLGEDNKSPEDGTAVSTFTPGVGYVIELSHPLNSGDPQDYALALHDTVGACFVYNDAENPADNFFGEVTFPETCMNGDVADGKEYAQVFKASFIDSLLKDLGDLVGICEFCPPDVGRRLDQKINLALGQSAMDHYDNVARLMEQFIADVNGFIRSGKLSERTGQPLIAGAQDVIDALQEHRAK